MPDRTCSCSVRVNAQLHQSSRAADARTRMTSMVPRQPTRCAASARCWPSDSADDARIDDGSGILGRLDVGIACSNFLHIRSNSLSRTELANAKDDRQAAAVYRISSSVSHTADRLVTYICGRKRSHPRDQHQGDTNSPPDARGRLSVFRRPPQLLRQSASEGNTD